jgi:adenylate cyclase
MSATRSPHGPEAGAVQPPDSSDKPVSVPVGHRHHSVLQWQFLEQLKRRNVVRVGILYLAVCWLILEPVHVIFHMLEVPVWANRLVVILMAVGLPAALAFAWVFELTPEGLKPASEEPQHRSLRLKAGQRLNRAIVVVMALALSYLLFDKFWLSRHFAPERLITATPRAAGVSAPAIPEKSVAVLPFLDMSEKKDQEYFSDGLSEELIDLLTKIPQLRVPARTSSFYFKGKQETIPNIAKALGVANVLEGSVRKSGSTLRITAQLIRADNGYHLWSQTYDRQLDDIFKVQDEIAGALVKALRVSLLEGQAPNAMLTTSSEAYELYLQARSLLRTGNSDDFLRAYADLQLAVRDDPKFAYAWSMLASILSDDSVDWTRVFKTSASPTTPAEVNQELQQSWSSQDTNRNWASSWQQARGAARAAAEQAIQWGPDLGRSHAAMGLVLLGLDWNWSAADVEFKRARELDPGNASITLQTARLAMFLGRLNEALELANQAYAQDPLGDSLGMLGQLQYFVGDYERAQQSLRRAIELWPTETGLHDRYARVLLARGEPQAALTEFEREAAPQFRDVGIPFALDALGRHAEADRAMALTEQQWGNGMAWNIACFYGSRNAADPAFAWLDRAYRQHDGGLHYLKVEPTLASLRRDPRYAELLHRLKLNE